MKMRTLDLIISSSQSLLLLLLSSYTYCYSLKLSSYIKHKRRHLKFSLYLYFISFTLFSHLFQLKNIVILFIKNLQCFFSRGWLRFSLFPLNWIGKILMYNLLPSVYRPELQQGMRLALNLTLKTWPVETFQNSGWEKS